MGGEMMTALTYAKQLPCDGCGCTADGAPEGYPDGWLDLGASTIRNLDGSRAVSDLCPGCKMRPFAEIWGLSDAGNP